MKVHRKTQSVEELQRYIADRVRKSRLVKGYSQIELSNLSSVSYSSIRRFEQTGEISLTSLLRIAETMNESINFENLFRRADFYSLVESGALKRPKLCKNGTYFSSRIISNVQLEKALDFMDEPTSFKKPTPKRNWKKLSTNTVDSSWDPWVEMKAIEKQMAIEKEIESLKNSGPNMEQ